MDRQQICQNVIVVPELELHVRHFFVQKNVSNSKFDLFDPMTWPLQLAQMAADSKNGTTL